MPSSGRHESYAEQHCRRASTLDRQTYNCALDHGPVSGQAILDCVGLRPGEGWKLSEVLADRSLSDATPSRDMQHRLPFFLVRHVQGPRLDNVIAYFRFCHNCLAVEIHPYRVTRSCSGWPTANIANERNATAIFTGNLYV